MRTSNLASVCKKNFILTELVSNQTFSPSNRLIFYGPITKTRSYPNMNTMMKTMLAMIG